MLYSTIVTDRPAITLHQNPIFVTSNPNITKNTRLVKTKYVVSKLNFANVSASMPEYHIKIIARKAVNGIPIRKAAIVTLRCAIILTVAITIPDINAFKKNSILLLFLNFLSLYLPYYRFLFLCL